MSDPVEYLWTVTRGDDSERVFEYRTEDDQPVDLTGHVATLHVEMGTLNYEVAGVVDGPQGRVTVEMTQALTTLFAGNGTFKLRLVSPAGKRHTLAYGSVRVIQ